MDYSVFNASTRIKYSLTDLNDPENNHIILFYCCYQHQALKYLSIKSSKMEAGITTQVENLSQNASIQFVRYAPSTLEWLRNDLTLENINMLQVERLQLGRQNIKLC